MKQPTKIVVYSLLGALAVLLPGCGSHDQNSPTSATGGTPPEIVRAAKQQQADIKNHPPPTAYVPPGTPGR